MRRPDPIMIAIMRRDPDGGERKPTEADYDAHRRWAIEAFGRGAWDQYRGEEWHEDYRDWD